MYESICELCNKEVLDKKSKSKWVEFKEMTGVYVGESSRSLYERIGEHWRDAKNGNGDSHMLKHWLEHHGDQEGYPRFRVRKVGSFGDALTRQISESVRIDLRGREY